MNQCINETVRIIPAIALISLKEPVLHLHECIRGAALMSRNIDEIIQRAETIYNSAKTLLKESFYASSVRPLPYPTYPFIGFKLEKHHIQSSLTNVLENEGLYGTTITHVDLFNGYLREQLAYIQASHDVEFVVGESLEKIPLPYAIADLRDTERVISHLDALDDFVMPNLQRINDDIPNGLYPESRLIKPLALFTAERIDFSINRLEHYTSTNIEHFQNFIIFTNYQRYIDAFLTYGIDLMQNNKDYYAFIGPDNHIIDKKYIKEGIEVLAQMPAYHLKCQDKNGITFINIGVGPSNAKNITDHLAVLRPHGWIMLGHCAGLRHNQCLGDYVLAHAYVREDHVLDDDLPPWVPIPALAEIQIALEEATGKICGEENVRQCLRTGTVITTDDRNWELKTNSVYERFKKARAIAIDMESATIAANGYRLRVPYGTLLCVSDKPIHGEIKLRGMANEFYKKRITQHLQIGLRTVELLKRSGIMKLHSRKLRGFDEPPFR